MEDVRFRKEMSSQARRVLLYAEEYKLTIFRALELSQKIDTNPPAVGPGQKILRSLHRRAVNIAQEIESLKVEAFQLVKNSVGFEKANLWMDDIHNCCFRRQRGEEVRNASEMPFLGEDDRYNPGEARNSFRRKHPWPSQMRSRPVIELSSKFSAF